MVESLGFRDDLKHLEEFNASFDEYRRLDDEILSLAIESTNLKAQRLSFGAARDAAAAFWTAISASVQANPSKDPCKVDAIAARAHTAVLEILVLQAPHIAEPEDGVMTRLENEMDASASAAKKALDELRAALGASPQLAAAGDALTRFLSVHSEISSCRAAIATCARWHCRSAGSARSPRPAKRDCRLSKPPSAGTRSPLPGNAHNSTCTPSSTTRSAAA